MRVLVAEDNPVVQSLLRSLLTKWGYEVVLVRSGAEAWEVLQQDAGVRLAILDWMMPGLDGIEVCRRVRAQPGNRYVYVILLSARAEQEDIVQALEAGADDYITKPFHAGELRARMRSAVRVVQLEESLARQAHYDALVTNLRPSRAAASRRYPSPSPTFCCRVRCSSGITTATWTRWPRSWPGISRRPTSSRLSAPAGPS
jgi:DNA-binding response OmpR family regulator